MHSIFALEQGGERGVWEMVLHLQQMDQLWHPTALLNNMLQIFVWITDELVDGLLVREDAILFVIFEHTEVWLSGHQ